MNYNSELEGLLVIFIWRFGDFYLDFGLKILSYSGYGF